MSLKSFFKKPTTLGKTKGKEQNKQHPKQELTLHSELQLNFGLSEKLMPFIVSVLVFIACFLVMIYLHFSSFSQNWHSLSVNQVTIEGDHLTDDQIAQIFKFTQSLDFVGKATKLSDAELQKLVDPWVKTDLAELDLEVPELIQVDFKKEPTTAQIAAFSEGILNFSFADQLIVHHHQKWVQDLLNAESYLSMVIALMVGFSVICLFAFVIYITLLNFAGQKKIISMLSTLGAKDNYIAHHFQKNTVKLAAIGSLIGFTLSLLAIYSLSFKLNQIDFFEFYDFMPTATQFLILTSVPLTLTLLLALCARQTVKITLKYANI